MYHQKETRSTKKVSLKESFHSNPSLFHFGTSLSILNASSVISLICVLFRSFLPDVMERTSDISLLCP